MSVLEDSTLFASKRFQFPVSHLEDVPFRPDAHLSNVPSVWTTYHTVQTSDKLSIIRPNDVKFHSDPLQYREASIPGGKGFH